MAEVEKLIDELHEKLTRAHYGSEEVDFNELEMLLLSVVNNISTDYQKYRTFIPRVLGLLEKNKLTALTLEIDVFLLLYHRLLNKVGEIKVSLPSYDIEYDESTSNKFLQAFRRSMSKGAQIRVSDFTLNKEGLEKADIQEIISMLIDTVQVSSKTLKWTDKEVQDNALQLPALRDLLNSQNDYKRFYFVSCMVLDRFGSSEYHQQARDMSEELILSSYKDGQPHLGYFNSFRCYSNSSSAIPGVLYSILCLTKALQASENLTIKFVKELIWQGIKFFRNISIHNLVKDMYDTIPDTLKWDAYEYRSLTHSYFLSLLTIREEDLPVILLDYLNKNREAILSGGIHDALPWLITLYNVKRLYPKADFSQTGLGFYVTTFEMIVPKERIQDQKTIILGEYDKMIPLLKESLVKLNETRNASDIVNDNDSAIKISGRIIEQAVRKNDFETLILVMLIRADFSIIFDQKERAELAPIEVPDTSLESFNKIYGSEMETAKKLIKDSENDFIWLLKAEEKCFYLSLMNSEFTSDPFRNWDNKKFNSLIRGGYFSKLAFDDTIKIKNEVRNILPEEQKLLSNTLKKEFEFISIDCSEANTKPLMVVFDMEVSRFPHNLLLDSNLKLISEYRPICNILSTEWFLKNSGHTSLSKNFKKAIWIPTKGGDFTLNHLYGKIENTLNKNRFEIQNETEPKKQISSELNIMCSHGANDISVKQVIFPDGQPRLNLNKYLGKGKILILFVCHSGSISTTPLENSISSIVKQFIAKGYVSIIAPFWSLQINIPPIWLPVFLNSLEGGDSVTEAVFKGNCAVFEKYPTLTASACMHLYGDPVVKMEK